MPKHLGSVLVPTLALLGACGSPPEATPAPVAATTPAPEAEPPAKAVEPTKPAEPAKAAEPTKPAEPAKAAEPTAPTTAPTASPLRVVAVREGQIGLRRHRDTPVLTLEGEPVPLVGGAIARRPEASLGLSPEFSSMATEDLTLAFGGSLDEPQGAWVSTARHFDRSASVYATYQWMGDRWKPIVERKGPIFAYYEALVEREGAVLALREWAADPKQDLWEGKDESQESIAHQAKVDRAKARAKPAWIRLAGAEVELPSIPKGMGIDSVVTDERGTIFALARKRGRENWESPNTVLTWPLGQRDPVPVDVPDLDKASNLGLYGSGEHTLITGWIEVDKDAPADPYLAVGHAGQWQRVPVSLPGHAPDAPFNVVGAARAPDGELWIALGTSWMPEPQPIWHKPVDGEWAPVPVPTVTADVFGPSEARVRDADDEEGGWVTVTRGPVDNEPMVPTGLVWAAGAVWIAGNLDFAYTGNLSQPPRRTVLLSSGPGDAPPVVLPSTWELQLERREHLGRTTKPDAE